MKKMFAAKEGFTLVELIVVIAILGILAAVAVPAYSGYIGQAHEAADITTVDAVKTAAQAALATKGEVIKVVVDAANETVTATVETGDTDTDYILRGTDAATPPAGSTEARADFATFFTDTDITFQQSGKTKATWPKATNDNSWSFS